jgi:hypothetical protein
MHQKVRLPDFGSGQGSQDNTRRLTQPELAKENHIPSSYFTKNSRILIGQ